MLKQSFVSMFYCILTFILLIENVFSNQLQNFAKLTKESCNYGDFVENLCSKCVCTAEGLYNCTQRDCQAVKEIYSKKPEACEPNKIYVQGYTTCLCTAEGEWPHKVCYDLFRYLPKYSVTKQTCEPQGYVRVDCNICRCNSKGEVDFTRCTVNECNTETPKYRKSNDEKPSLFGQCILKNWYSLAPCQFCYCVDTNKLMCSTSILPTNRQGTMTLGQSTLTLCGPGLLKEIAALVPNKLSRLRSLLSSNEDVNSLIAQDATHNENMEETNEAFIEKRSGPVDTPSEIARNTDYNDGEDKAEVNENKNNLEDVTIDIAASFDAKRKRRRNGESTHDDAASNGFRVRRLLTLDGGTKCKPGTAVNIKCNPCHCLKNGKLLCTDNKCN